MRIQIEKPCQFCGHITPREIEVNKPTSTQLSFACEKCKGITRHHVTVSANVVSEDNLTMILRAHNDQSQLRKETPDSGN